MFVGNAPGCPGIAKVEIPEGVDTFERLATLKGVVLTTPASGD